MRSRRHSHSILETTIFVIKNTSESGGNYIPVGDRVSGKSGLGIQEHKDTGYSSAGTWVKHKVGTEVTYAKDNGDSLLEEIIFKNIYEYEFVQNDGPSTFDLINGAIGSYLTLLDEYAGANSKFVYKYGTKAISATALTQANAARMLGIAKNAQIVGNTLGIITGGYSLYKAEQKRRTTGEIDVKGYLDGTIGLAGGIAGTIVTFGLVSNPAGWAILATGAAIYGIGSFIYDVNNANE